MALNTSGGPCPSPSSSDEKTFQQSCSSPIGTQDYDKRSFDLERVLREWVQRRDDAGIKSRELGVMFRDLRVVGIDGASSYQPTFGSMFSPQSIVEQVQTLRHPSFKNILHGFEGVVRPGEMLLVLGRPGAGCSTFLKTLANHREEYCSVDGQVTYDSITPNDMKNRFRGDIQYCPEDDVHFPTLTVEQTIRFAVEARTPRTSLTKSRDEHIQTETDTLMSIFGLTHARNTKIGDAMIRGISGGEKKRVSIAEALAGRSCINVWDNSTRGLDSSTALEFISALRVITDIFRTTTIVSLYQAGEPLYELFDKVCVIYEGQMAYFGPADLAKQYFIDMGYEPANRQTTADFLVTLTDPHARISRPGVLTMPRTADEFRAYFEKSSAGLWNKGDISAYEAELAGKSGRATAYIESARAEHAKGTNYSSPYITSIAMQTRAVMLRRAQIICGNMLATGVNFWVFVCLGLIQGSVFFNTEDATSDYFSRGSILTNGVLFSSSVAFAEIPALYIQRPIVLRHAKAALYHPFIEALAACLVDIPIIFVTSVAWSIVLYFMVGLQQTAGQFFIFLLFVFAMYITVKMYIRVVVAACASEPVAQAISGGTVFAAGLYTGYMIPEATMVRALRWISYINPARYGFEAAMANEFRTLRGACTSLLPQGPGYENATIENQVCPVVGALPGETVVDGNRYLDLTYGFSSDNIWRNLGILVVFAMVFLIAMLITSEYITTSVRSSSMILFKRGAKQISSKSSDEEANANTSSNVAGTGTNTAATSVDGSKSQPDIFSWQHLNYTVPVQDGERMLLDDVSGFVAPGKLTALMGATGAGKTTLLNVLAHRIDVGVVTGDRFVNGQPVPVDFQAQSGYCQQTDTHVPTDTVREALLFSAKLRQPKDVPMSEKEEWVEKCLHLCGLEEWADASVGSLGTEHRKRTTIAIELASKPKLLLFLDEPTSGLDSQSAWAIVSFLKHLADNGQAILCTIHQPSAELFQLFDRLLLLQKGGQTVYFGDVGDKAHTIIDYFERNGGRPCLPDENPAEYMLDAIGAGATATSSFDWYKIWQDSPEAQALQCELDAIHLEGRKRAAAEVKFHSEFATPWPFQIKELLIRDARAHWRDPSYLTAKLGLNIFAGLLTGFSFWSSADSQRGTQNKLFSIFMATIISLPLSYQLQVPFVAMRDIYEVRERPSRIYSWTALVTSQMLIELPWNILGSTLFFVCWYWSVGFDTLRAGYTYLMLGAVFPVYFTTFAQAIAAMSPTAEIAGILFSFMCSFVVTFCGVLQPFNELGWWKWMYHLSPFTYLTGGLLGQAIGRTEIRCSDVEYVALTPPPNLTCGEYMNTSISLMGGYLTNPDATSNCQFCGVRSADAFLEHSFNIRYDHRWRNFGFMMAFIALNVVTTYALTYLFRIRKQGGNTAILSGKRSPRSKLQQKV